MSDEQFLLILATIYNAAYLLNKKDGLWIKIMMWAMLVGAAIALVVS